MTITTYEQAKQLKHDKELSVFCKRVVAQLP